MVRRKISRMERQEVIREWECINGVKLQSTYVNNTQPMKYTILAGEYKGLEGVTTYNNIATKGNKVTFIALTKESKNKYLNSILEDFGAIVVGEYTGVNDPIPIKLVEGNYKGYYGKTTKNNLNQKRSRGKIKALSFDVLYPEEKIRYMTTYAKSRGYTIIQYPENESVVKPMIMESPQGNLWETTWNRFTRIKNGKETDCPLDNNLSYGVRIINTLLKINDISYIPEKSILTGETYQFLDFYLPEYKLAIEYNGEQHYKDTGGWYSQTLQKVQELDKRKDAYCASQGIKMVVIPYTKASINEIYTILTEHLPLKVKPEYIENTEQLDEEAILKYYKTHEAKEVYKKFGITPSKLQRIIYTNNFNKQKTPVKSLNVRTQEIKEYESTTQAKRATGCKGVIRCIQGKDQYSTGTDGDKYLWAKITDGFNPKALNRFKLK